MLRISLDKLIEINRSHTQAQTDRHPIHIRIKPFEVIALDVRATDVRNLNGIVQFNEKRQLSVSSDR